MNYLYIALLIILWKEYDHARAFAMSLFDGTKKAATAAKDAVKKDA